MTSLVKGKTITEADELFEVFQRIVTSEIKEPVELFKLGKLAAFSGVREFPTRIKCATLAWHTLSAALHNEESVVSTE
jgi:nitrogen fixation NifU-like protein